jgi:hypothetical protein
MASGKLVVSSLALGSMLLATTLLLAWLSTTSGYSENILKWGVLPVLGYVYTVVLNLSLQSFSCGKVNASQIAVTSLATPLFILIAAALTLLGFVRAPIASAVPLKMRLTYGGIVAVAFYMFWAGMFGEAYAGNTSMVCPNGSA